MSDQTTGDLGGSDSAAAKPPQEWTTGDEPATAAQLSYLGTLAREAGEDVPDELTKAQASELIDRLRARSPRVADD
jgi:hypothetical protein